MKNELSEIETIYEYGSFSRAAEQLGMTQPTLSTRVKKLENQLGCIIFDRADEMRLTAEGKVVLDYARQRKQLDIDLRRRLADLSEEELTGTLTIGSAHGFTAGYIPMILAKYHSCYPKVKVVLLDSEVTEIAERMKKGEVDLLITTFQEKESEFVSKEIFEGEIFLCVPEQFCKKEWIEKYAVTRKMFDETSLGENLFPAVDLSWFSEFPFILLPEKLFIGKVSREMLKRAGIDVSSPMLMSNQMVTSVAMSQYGLGISFVTEDYVRYTTGTFPPIFRINDKGNRRRACVSYLKKRYLSREVQAFLNIINESEEK